MNLEAYRERIEEILYGMNTPELVSAWNDFCSNADRYDDFVFYNDEDELNEQLSGLSAYEILCRAHYGDYDLTDDYACWNGYANLNSFNFSNDEKSPIYIPEMVDYIIDNEDSLGISEIDDLISGYDDEDGDFEESVQRKRPRRRKK